MSKPNTANKDNTLTVADLLAAVASGRVSMDMPIGVWSADKEALVGVHAFEIHTYDNMQVFVVHNTLDYNNVADQPGNTAAELF